MITAAEKPVASDGPLLLGGEAAARPASRAGVRFRPALSIVVLAWAVRLVSVFNLLNAILRYQPKFIFWLGKWVPMEVSEGMRIRMFLMSVLLLILASGLERGKKLAWQITVVGLLLAPILHLDRGVIWPAAMANLLLIGYLVCQRHYFVVESDPRSIRSALVICPALGAGLLIFGTARLHALHKDTVGEHTWTACARTAGELVFLHHATTQLPVTKQAGDLFATLRVGGTSIALVGLCLILRPVMARRRVRAEHREQVRRLIALHGGDPMDPYALLSDKQYFFTGNGEAAVPYVVSGKLAVTLAGPIGPAEERAAAITEFALYCRHRDWRPVFYGINDEMLKEYEQAGLGVFKVSEEAWLRADQFTLKGGEFQNLRTACNAARKRGLVFRWYDAAAGIDLKLEEQLAEISRDWLEGKRTGEMAFDMGAFSEESIRRLGAAVALDPEGRALAFATWRAFAQGRGRCLDLMRSRPSARNVMDFVLVESILRFKAMGVRDVSLGGAPLANADPGSIAPLGEEKAVRFLFENLNRVYGYKSLFEFKRKYRPEWRGRYIAYHRGLHLPLVGLAVVRVHAPSGLWRFFLA
jgi:lysylphosphatidylglycerol synthetase-like protein (DUF2156 family)